MKEFNLVLTPGVETNDKIILDYIHEKYGKEMSWSFYSLAYSPPYEENWEGIKNYEKICRYHPFTDESQEKAIIIDLKEWISESRIQEDFINIFLMYLHDQHSYFDLKYVFTVGGYEEKAVRKLIILLSQYFEKGYVEIRRVLKNIEELEHYISRKHKRISVELAYKIASMVIESDIKISGISQLDSLISGLENSISNTQAIIDEKLLSINEKQVKTSGFYMLYEKEMEKMIREYEKYISKNKDIIEGGRIA